MTLVTLMTLLLYYLLLDTSELEEEGGGEGYKSNNGKVASQGLVASQRGWLGRLWEMTGCGGRAREGMAGSRGYVWSGVVG